MFTFSFEDKIEFTKAVYYHSHKIPLPKPSKGGIGGMGKLALEQGCIEPYDQEDACAHPAVRPGLIADILPTVLNGEEHSYNEWGSSFHWKIRDAGFQSEKAVEVGQLDLMMLDMPAQREGKPLYRSMGANKDWAQTYKGGGSLLLEDHELVEDMIRYAEEGYTMVKFKMGSQDGMDMERDLCRIEMVREATGDRVGAAVGCNQRQDVDSIFRFAEPCEPYNLAWLEEPIHPHDTNGIRRLKDTGMVTPIALGESMRTHCEYETYIEKGMDHVQSSLSRMTRADDIVRTCDLAHEKGVRFTSGGRIYPNAILGCLYSEDEQIEYHESISRSVGAYTPSQPEEKNGRPYYQLGLSGNPQRMGIDKLEKDEPVGSREIYYSKN